MGIDLFMEDEQGIKLAEVLDPHGCIGRIVSLFGDKSPGPLHFIDPYGDTVFNQLQIPLLIRELEAARDLVTDDAVARLARQEIEDALKANWDHSVIQSIESPSRTLSAPDIRACLESIIDLANRAQGQPHTYLKFYGD
jgi:hypothetical protein